MAAQPAADPVDQRHREQAAAEGEDLNKDDLQGKQHGQHCARRRAARHAQDVGRHQRVAQDSLVHSARGSERRAHESCRQHARAAGLEDHRLEHGEGGERKRITPDQQGEHDEREEPGECDGERGSVADALDATKKKRRRRPSTIPLMIKRIVFALATLLCAATAQAQTVRMATTTSTANTGLLDYLLPKFRSRTGITVQYVAVGTGAALKIGEQGDADVVLVHDRESEEKFVAAGFGVKRRDVMYNDFVIVGAPADPAQIRGINHAGATRLIDWLTSDEGQRAIAEYKVGGAQLFFPSAK